MTPAFIGWCIKKLVDHRRSGCLDVRAIQTQAHTKVLDRLSSNEELLAYIQTPAGSRFLESAPIPMEGPRSIGAPIGRILFSAQAGTVVGFPRPRRSFCKLAPRREFNLSDAAPFLFMVGIVALAVGVGFLVSSGIAYVLSRHLGLLEGPTSSHA